MKLKKLILIVCTLCFGLALALGLTACFGSGGGNGDPVPARSIGLDKTSLELNIGESATLRAVVSPSNSTDAVVWSSSDRSVATVAGGKVTAVAAGNADITVTAGEHKATCKVKVKGGENEPSDETVRVESVTLNGTSLNLEVGGKATLTATVKPENATDKAVVWKSSDDKIATVAGGIVTAKAVGTAEITATADGRSATCAVTVNEKKAEVIAVTSVTLNESDLELKVGESFTLTATVKPDNATDKTVTWSSSNTSAATVEGGVVTAKAVGTAKITATAGGKTKTCEVGVIANTVTPDPVEPIEPDPVIPPSKNLTYAHAGEESAAFEWKDGRASGAKVEYKLTSASGYTSIDKQLIRQISSETARADILGLKGGARYDFKITTSGNEVITVGNVEIAALDRSGYAHFNYTKGVGAYNDDGTLKSNTTVIYVTEENKNDIDGKGTSIAEYLSKAKNNKTPIVIRIIGTVGSATWKEIEYNDAGKEGEDITVDKVVGANGKKLPTDNGKLTQAALISGGYNELNEYPEKLGGKRCVAIDGLISKAKYTAASGSKPAEYDSAWNDCQVVSVSNITIEGVGEDAEIFQWGFTFKSCNSVEVRNLRFYDYTEDACSVEGSENSETLSGFKHKNFWIHHNTFDIGVNYWDVCPEQDKHDGDGATDFKYLAYITVAYNRYNGTHKTGLVGGGDSAHQACFTFHHNYYNGCDQRMPLGRQANMHIYNNYFYKSGLYSISLRAGAYAFVENCVFTSGKSSTKPIELVKGTNGTPSCKVIDCDLGGKSVTNNVGSDYLYVGTDRTKTVKGSNLYGLNFEQADGFYTVTNKLKTSEVASKIPVLAGVTQRSANIKLS